MKTLELEINISIAKEQLWSAWINGDNVVKWFSPIANVEPKVGGAFELFFDPSNLNHMTTKGCTFLELIPYERLSFYWKGPDNFSDVMNKDPLTIVNATFIEEGKDIKVKITHTGWGVGEEWDAAREWHKFAWNQVLNSLKEYLESSQGNICCKN